MMLERELRRVILCERGAVLELGELVNPCPGDCLAHLMGWRGMYVDPLRTRHGWQVPTRGDLGPGWPDLVLIRRGRVVVAELKRQGQHPEELQLAVLLELRGAGLEAYVWRPSDLDSGLIYRILQRGDAMPRLEPDELDRARILRRDASLLR